MREPRREARASIDDHSRITLLETDFDRMEANFERFKEEIRTEVRAIKTLMWSVLVTALTATIGGIINLIILAPWGS